MVVYPPLVTPAEAEHVAERIVALMTPRGKRDRADEPACQGAGRRLGHVGHESPRQCPHGRAGSADRSLSKVLEFGSLAVPPPSVTRPSTAPDRPPAEGTRIVVRDPCAQVGRCGGHCSRRPGVRESGPTRRPPHCCNGASALRCPERTMMGLMGRHGATCPVARTAAEEAPADDLGRPIGGPSGLALAEMYNSAVRAKV